MKKRIINLLGIGIISLSVVAGTVQPVYATEVVVQAEESESTSDTTSETSETTEKQKTPSVLKIQAYNNTTGKNESSAVFQIIDRSNGNTVAFSKDSAGKYTVDSKGSYKYLEPSDGYVEVTGLSGSYTVEDATSNQNLYCESDSSNFSIKEEDSKTVKFEYVQNYGSLNITLLSEDDSAIADAKFVLKNSSGSTLSFNLESGVYKYSSSGSTSELTTNAAGKIMLDSLPAGTYTVEQKSAPVVYNGALASKTITVENQKDVSLTLTNTKEYGDLIVSIVDSGDNSKSLSGSEFTIKNTSGENIYLIKNTDGSYAFSRTSSETTAVAANGNLSISGLPKGSYILTEKTASSGYNVADYKEFDIQKNNTTSIQIKEVRSVGSLTITITDEETGDAVEGFVYQLISKDTDKAIGFKESASGYIYSSNGDTEVETDADGKILLTNIPTGNYYLKQVKAANGYLLDLDSIEQSISTDLETNYVTVASKSNSAVVVINQNGDAVEGVGFEVIDSNGDVILTDVTNENGKYLISGVSAGEYTLKITSVPETYGKYADVIKFSIDDTGLSDGLGRITLDYNKVTVNLGQKDLAVILMNKKDNSSVTLTTDKDGVVTFSQLEYGKYSITLEDDTIDFEEITFEVDEDFDDLSYDVTIVDSEESAVSDEETSLDESIADEAPVSKKMNSSIIVVIILAVIAVLAAVYFFFIRKKKDDNADDDTEGDEDNVHVGYDEDGNAVIYEEVEVEVDADNAEDLENTEDSEVIDNDMVLDESVVIGATEELIAGEEATDAVVSEETPEAEAEATEVDAESAETINEDSKDSEDSDLGNLDESEKIFGLGEEETEKEISDISEDKQD